MWTGRITLIAFWLLVGGGWTEGLHGRAAKRAVLVAVPVIVGFSFVPTLRASCARLCFAPCAFALLAAMLYPSDEPVRTVCAAMLGGLIGWKLCDTFPLFFEPGLLAALPTLLLAVLLCRTFGARALALAAAPFFLLLFRAIGDWILFESTVLELGDGDALSAQASGILLLTAGAAAFRAVWEKRFRRFTGSPDRKVAQHE